MTRWNLLLIIIGLLLWGCSTSSDSEDDPNAPFNTSAQELPGSFHYNEPPSLNVEFSDPDGFSSGTISYEQNGEVVWSLDLAGTGTSVQKSWTPNPQTPGEAYLRWTGQDAHPSDPQSFEGSKRIEIQDTRYLRNASIQVQDIFGERSVNGHVTLVTPEELRTVTTLEIQDGVARIDYQDKVDADSLEAGLYRNMIEATNFVTHSSMTSANAPIEIIPEDWGNGNTYDDYDAHLSRFNVLPEELRGTGAEAVTFKWPEGSSPVVGI